jgi:hypothetical protein
MALTPNDLANAMEGVMAQAWTAVKGPDVPFPGGDPSDRKVLFLAVAWGLLKYLETNQNDVINTIRLNQSGVGAVDYSVETLDLDITGI